LQQGAQEERTDQRKNATTPTSPANVALGPAEDVEKVEYQTACIAGRDVRQPQESRVRGAWARGERVCSMQTQALLARDDDVDGEEVQESVDRWRC